MKKKKIRVLIVEDHPLIVAAYKVAFDLIGKREDRVSFGLVVAPDCETARHRIREYTQVSEKLTLMLLDIRLPPSKDGKIQSGEDLGLLVRRLLPDTKIICSTLLDGSYRIRSIFRTINPDGFLIKSDVDADELITVIAAVLAGKPYYSETVLTFLRKEATNKLLLDDIDRKILYELSIGTKTKDLQQTVHRSLPAIEKRKRRLKQLFNLEQATDKELLLVAKEKGFI